MKRIFLLFVLGLLPAALVPLCAETCVQEYRFRVSFADKVRSPYSLRHPERFLSRAALARRHKWRIKVDYCDLPVSPGYVEELRRCGARVLCTSRWNNSALVAAADSAALHARLSALPFVRTVLPFGAYRTDPKADSLATARLAALTDTLPAATADTGRAAYGRGLAAIDQLNGRALHEAGFRGRGITIAVLDGGFRNADTVALLRGVDVRGTHNFVRPALSVFAEQEHGTNVLSCMAANRRGVLVGTAPEAGYLLIVTEDAYTEMPYEHDFWAAGIELADSLGADVVTSSLGYNRVDNAALNPHYHQQDGRTAFISRTASLAAGRGLMLLNSAGNDGRGTWKRISFPGDARDMLTVGAVDKHGMNAQFSSVGPTADGRVKPDIMALGVGAAVAGADGSLRTANGTSFACPITAGLTACLMQALPRLRPETIIRLIQQSGQNAAHPDNIFGYGIPDFARAYEQGKSLKK